MTPEMIFSLINLGLKFKRREKYFELAFLEPVDFPVSGYQEQGVFDFERGR